MKIVIIENNLFKTFKGYSQQNILFVVKTFHNERFFLKLLERQFGPNFDGENAKKDLQYSESERLNLSLNRFLARLKYVTLMRKIGKKFEDIEKIFDRKKDYEIDKIVTSYLRSKETTKTEEIYQNLTQIRKNLGVSDAQILDAAENLSSVDAKIAFKYTYGLGCKRMEPNQIIQMLKIDKKTYYEYLKEAYNKLPTLIGIIKNQEVETKNINNSRSNPSVKKNRSRKKPMTFFAYFYAKEMSEEEKRQIDEKVKLAIEYWKSYSKKGYEAFCAYYDSEYRLIKGINAYGNAKYNFSRFKKKIGELITTYSLEELQQMLNCNDQIKVKHRKRPMIFFEYFYMEEMSEEEKRQIDEKVKLAIEYQKSYTKKGYEAFCIFYDREYNLIKVKNSSDNIRLNFANFKKKIEALITTYSLEELQKMINSDDQIKVKKHTRPMTFFAYFYTKEMSEEEKRQIDEKVKLAIEYQKSYSEKGYADFCILYDKEYKIIASAKVRASNFKDFKKKIGELITTYSLEELQQMLNSNDQIKVKKHTRPMTFFAYFYTEEMIEEEKRQIDEKVKLAIEYQKCGSIKGYEAFCIFYDREYNLIKVKNVSDNTKFNFANFKKKIEELITKYSLEELQQMLNSNDQIKVKKHTRPMTFFAYFYAKEMSEEEKSQIDEKVKLAIEYWKSYSKKGYEAFCTFYDSEYKLIKVKNVSDNTKFNFANFKKKIEELITKYSLEELQQMLNCNDQIKVKHRKRPMIFFEYFYMEEMSEEGKKQLAEKVKLAIEYQKLYTRKGYEAFCIFYDKEYNLIKVKNSSDNIRLNFANFKKKIEALITTYSLEELQKMVNSSDQIKIEKHTRPMNFFAYFYTKEMSEEEKRQIDEKVKLAIEYQKSYSEKGYEDFCILYDKDYKITAATSVTRGRFEAFKKKIEELITTYSLEELQKMINISDQIKIEKHTRPMNFFAYFYTEEMIEEEKKEIEEKVKLAIEYQKCGSIKGYEAFCTFYDSEYKLIKVKNVSDNTKFNFVNFKKKIEELITTYSLEELQKMLNISDQIKVKKHTRPMTFFAYFYTKEMSKDEKKEIEEKVKLAIEYQKSYSEKGYEEFSTLYDKDYKITAATSVKPWNFEAFKKKIKELITTYSLEELQKMNNKEIVNLQAVKNELQKIPNSFKKESSSDKNNLKKQNLIKRKEELLCVKYQYIKAKFYDLYKDILNTEELEDIISEAFLSYSSEEGISIELSCQFKIETAILVFLTNKYRQNPDSEESLNILLSIVEIFKKRIKEKYPYMMDDIIEKAIEEIFVSYTGQKLFFVELAKKLK